MEMKSSPWEQTNKSSGPIGRFERGIGVEVVGVEVVDVDTVVVPPLFGCVSKEGGLCGTFVDVRGVCPLAVEFFFGVSEFFFPAAYRVFLKFSSFFFFSKLQAFAIVGAFALDSEAFGFRFGFREVATSVLIVSAGGGLVELGVGVVPLVTKQVVQGYTGDLGRIRGSEIHWRRRIWNGLDPRRLSKSVRYVDESRLVTGVGHA